jgi:hypothetical protein
LVQRMFAEAALEPQCDMAFLLSVATAGAALSADQHD